MAIAQSNERRLLSPAGRLVATGLLCCLLIQTTIGKSVDLVLVNPEGPSVPSRSESEQEEQETSKEGKLVAPTEGLWRSSPRKVRSQFASSRVPAALVINEPFSLSRACTEPPAVLSEQARRNGVGTPLRC